MLMSESLAIGEMLKAAVIDPLRGGRAAGALSGLRHDLRRNPDRQDAVVAMLADGPPDLMIVIGGYNSSNTCNLARMCAEKCPTFHIADRVAWYRPNPSGTGRSAQGGNLDARLATL